MLFTNACIENKTKLQDIRVKNGCCCRKQEKM